MATNPLNMRPTELIRLMNRAGFGTILNESRLKTHRLNDINTADGKGVLYSDADYQRGQCERLADARILGTK